MKTLTFYLLVLVIIGFTSCDLNRESNHKPDIVFVQNPMVNNADTLNVYYTDQANVFRMDTIFVGDTVRFRLYITGFSNNLKQFRLNQLSDSVNKIILPGTSSMDSVFLSGSNYAEGKFLMDGTATSLFFPFEYVAIKASLEARLIFIVVSDADFEYNQFSFVLKTPIAPAP
jgi:hypothetical protein